jgi:ribonuclease P protein component
VHERPGRLQKRQDFLRVQAGRRVQKRHLVIYSAPGDFRVGFTVSRKVGNAVVRNRVRRRLRESLRLHPERLASDRDYVIIANPSAARAHVAGLDYELAQLLARTRPGGEA